MCRCLRLKHCSMVSGQNRCILRKGGQQKVMFCGGILKTYMAGLLPLRWVTNMWSCELERNQYQMVQDSWFAPSHLLFSWFLKNQPPPCSVTRLSIDSLSLCNDELRVWEQGHCTNRAELLWNEWLVPGGWDSCFWLLTWRKIQQVRSSCWMKAHPSFELPSCSFTCSMKWGRGAASWALCPRWSGSENRQLWCELFSPGWVWWHVPIGDMKTQAGAALLCGVTGTGKPSQWKRYDSKFRVLSDPEGSLKE